MFPLHKNDKWKNHLSIEDFTFDEENRPKAKVLAELQHKIEHINNNQELYRQKNDMKLMMDH